MDGLWITLDTWLIPAARSSACVLVFLFPCMHLRCHARSHVSLLFCTVLRRLQPSRVSTVQVRDDGRRSKKRRRGLVQGRSHSSQFYHSPTENSRVQLVKSKLLIMYRLCPSRPRRFRMRKSRTRTRTRDAAASTNCIHYL